MLDLIHYFFEVDLQETLYEGAAEGRDKYRIQIYEDLYGEEYAYASPSSRSKMVSFDPNLPPVDGPVNNNLEPEGFKGGQPSVRKGYIPPTQIREGLVNPYEGLLDAPLN